MSYLWKRCVCGTTCTEHGIYVTILARRYCHKYAKMVRRYEVGDKNSKLAFLKKFSPLRKLVGKVALGGTVIWGPSFGV